MGKWSTTGGVQTGYDEVGRDDAVMEEEYDDASVHVKDLSPAPTSRRQQSAPLVGHVYLRYLLSADVLLLFVLGFAWVFAGAWARFGSPMLQNYPLIYVHTAAYALMALGITVVVMATIGFCVVLSAGFKRLLPAIFFALLLTIFLLILVSSCWAIAQTNARLDQMVGDALRQSVQRYNIDSQAKLFMDTVQLYLSCCGADGGFGDYAVYDSLVGDNVCVMQFFGDPCFGPLREYMLKNLVILSGLIISLLLFTLIGMLLTILMSYAECKLRNRSRCSTSIKEPE